MNKHTPGPWYFTSGLTGETVIRTHASSDAECENIAVVLELLEAEAEANARLIAAAPELLDLLAESLVYVEEAPTDGYKPGKGPKDLAGRIRNLIAKAEGE